MHSISIIVLFGFVAVCLTMSENEGDLRGHEANHVATGKVDKQIRLVANVDGKSYFVDYDNRNWWDADNYCKSLGMQLATITTSAEAAALKGATALLATGWGFWIGGRESQSREGFVWNIDSSGLPTVLPFYKYSNVEYPYGLCVLFHNSPTSSSNSGFYLRQCNVARGVLCQS